MTNTCHHCKRTIRYVDRCHNCGADLREDALDAQAERIPLSECWGVLRRIAEAKLRYHCEYKVIIGDKPYIITA